MRRLGASTALLLAAAVAAPAPADAGGVLRVVRHRAAHHVSDIRCSKVRRAAHGVRRCSALRATGPLVTTGGATAVTQSSAQLEGTVNPRGTRTTYHVDYGTTTAYGLRTPGLDASAGAGRTAVAVSAVAAGLTRGTPYHYRLVATNCGGCSRGTGYGADRTFTTSAPPPAPATYQNPVFGSFPDPMAYFTGADYYTFGTGDLFPVIHSTDLVNWVSVGTAFTARPSWSSGNSWAPSVLGVARPCPDAPAGSTSGACYFMYYVGLNNALATASNCIGVATADAPAGPYRDHGILTTASGAADPVRGPIGCGDGAGYSNIDPAPYVDGATGRAYLYLSTGHDATGPSHRTLSVIPLAADLLHAAGDRIPLFSADAAWEHDVVEGPWPEQHGSAVYLFYSGGSFTDASYAVGYAVAPSASGPFAKAPASPILKSTPDVIGPGGGSVTPGPHGGDWMVYHGRAVAGGPRMLRIDPLVWDDTAVPATVTVRGPTTSPQPVP